MSVTSKIKSNGGNPLRTKSNWTSSPKQTLVTPVIVPVILFKFGRHVTVSIAIHAGFKESNAVTWKLVTCATVASGFWTFGSLSPATPPLVMFDHE